MAAAKKKQDDKHLAILRELVTKNGNKNCFDCSQRGPTYVNMTIGSFVCSKCSGMLRGLTPPHRVKSISMASFTPEEIEQIKSQGNDACAAVWCALLEDPIGATSGDEQAFKDHLADKYEKKRFYMEGGPRKERERRSRPKQALPPVSQPATLVQPVPNVSQNLPCPRFPVDFAINEAASNAMNISSVLRSPPAPALVSHPIPSPLHLQPVPAFANFDMINANTVSNTSTEDRYAALAALDCAFRQTHTHPTSDMKSPISSNPFDELPTGEVSRNPFHVNGNILGYTNPFTTTQARSSNPFL